MQRATDLERSAEARVHTDARRCHRRLRDWSALWRTLGVGHPQEQAAFERMNRAFTQMLHDAEVYAALRQRAQQEQSQASR